jgi:AraC family transcriptional regulator
VGFDEVMTTLPAGKFLGAIERQVELADAMLSLVHHAQTRQLPLHQHDRPYFCFLVNGKYEEEYGGARLAYEPFSIALHPARYAHSDAILEAQSTFFTIELGRAWASELDQPYDFSKWRLELQHGDAVWLAVRLLRAFLDDAADALLVEACVSEMLAIALRMLHEPPARPWIYPVKAILHERFTQKITLAELASAAGLHVATVARGFRVAEGVTIGDYVQRMRIQYACRLLSDGTKPLADIARECGFADQSHLTRVFKAITGATPAALRAEIAPR